MFICKVFVLRGIFNPRWSCGRTIGRGDELDPGPGHTTGVDRSFRSHCRSSSATWAGEDFCLFLGFWKACWKGRTVRHTQARLLLFFPPSKRLAETGMGEERTDLTLSRFLVPHVVAERWGLALCFSAFRWRLERSTHIFDIAWPEGLKTGFFPTQKVCVSLELRVI